MRIDLYNHNKIAYDNALFLLQAEKKAAIIHPTGTGKSFIAFKLCEDNPDKKICWLSPSEYIFDTQLENLKRATGGYVPQNISFFTYAKLMNMSKVEISAIKPDYIILFRPTVSPIIYKQQIGRALQTGIKQSSVIFDIVMNIENLYSIGTIEEEMRLAVSYYRSHGLESNIINEHFRVIDEVKECISLFDKLNETLTASWDFMYAEAKKYYEQNGNLEISTTYTDENGLCIGRWLKNQRKNKAKLKINGENGNQIKRLESIGIAWENTDAADVVNVSDSNSIQKDELRSYAV